MPNSPEILDDLQRLQNALEALSSDLDAIERRPHYSLHFCAGNVIPERPHGIEDAVSNFAVAMKRGSRFANVS